MYLNVFHTDNIHICICVECLCSMCLRSGTSEIWRWRWDLLCSYRDLKLRLDRRQIGTHTYDVKTRWSVAHSKSSVFSVLVQELVELVLTDLERKPRTGVDADAQYTCLEVGCGSGAISLSLLKSLPQVRCVHIEGKFNYPLKLWLRLKYLTYCWIHHLKLCYRHSWSPEDKICWLFF